MAGDLAFHLLCATCNHFRPVMLSLRCVRSAQQVYGSELYPPAPPRLPSLARIFEKEILTFGLIFK